MMRPPSQESLGTARTSLVAACYHMVGLLEEARLCKGDATDVPWRETYLRFSGQSWREFDLVVEGWTPERSETRNS